MKGTDQMLQDKFMIAIDELVAEFTAKVIAEKDAEFAKKKAEIDKHVDICNNSYKVKHSQILEVIILFKLC